MPFIPPSPCTYAGCKMMRTKGSRCDSHQPIPWLSSLGKSRHERGYGYHWERMRKKALERDQYLCQECKAQGFMRPANEVDHIVNKASGGSDDLSNLRSLCRQCHKLKTIEERPNGKHNRRF